jgi:hypothetical protein
MEDRMTLSFRTILLLIAVVIFVVAAFGVDVRGVPLGLAFVAAAFLVPDIGLPRRV